MADRAQTFVKDVIFQGNVDFTNATVTGILPVLDTTALVKDPADPTKKAGIDAGNVATATLRRILMPDADVPLFKSFSGASDPTVTDDSDSGYAVGSHGFNTATKDVFECVDSTVGAAEWSNLSLTVPVIDTIPLVKDPADPTKLVRIDGGAIATGTTRVITMPDADVPLFKSFSAGVDPVATDDSNSGYAVGSRGLNTASKEVFECVDSTVGAAEWKNITTTTNLFNSNGTVGANRIATLTDTLQWAGGRTTYLNNAITSTINATNLVEVKQASDLPATLVSDTTYLIRGAITLDTEISVTNEGCCIIGIDRNKDKLIWDGLTGTTMITVTDVDFSISNLCLSANNTGAILIEADNYDGAEYNSGRLKVFTIVNCQFRNCFDVASFEGFDMVDISNTLFWYIEAPNFGIKFLNTSKIEISSCEFIRWFDESSIPTPAGFATCPMVEFLTNGGGSGFGAVNIGGCVIHPQQTQDGIKINSGSTTGFGTISANTFVDVNLTSGLKFFPDPSTGGYSNAEALNYDIAVNQGIANSQSYMLCTFSGNVNDTDLASGVPAAIEGDSLPAATNSQRFTLTNTLIGANTTPVIEYVGTKDIYTTLMTTVSYDKQGGGIDEYRFSYYMDTGSGFTQLTNSELIIDAGADADELTVTLAYAANFEQGHKVAIYCENPSSGDDILVKSIQWVINE